MNLPIEKKRKENSFMNVQILKPSNQKAKKKINPSFKPTPKNKIP